MHKIAVLAPIAWRTPPLHYGPWEQVASNIAEGLVKRGYDVTLFATLDSQTAGTLDGVCPRPYEEDRSIDPKVWECLHISHLMEQADTFDLIHNNYDFLPLSYTGLIDTPVVTTIHGFSSPQIIPVYKKYNGGNNHYISISDSDRSDQLDYLATVYNGIKVEEFTFCDEDDGYLLFFGRIHPHKGAKECIEIAKRTGRKLKIAGIVQDQDYFETYVKPHINGDSVEYLGPVPRCQRSDVLGRASALLHPISFDEPFGLSVAEAMACGTPVIAFERGSMPELIEDSVTGFLVKDIDGAIEAVGRLGEIKADACRNRVVDLFSVDKMVEGYIEAYKKVLSTSSVK